MIQCSPLDHGSSGMSFPFTAVHGNYISTSCCVGSQRGTKNVGLGKADPRFIEEVSSGKEASA